MKRYGNLYSQITDLDNIMLAVQNAAANKKKHDEVQDVLAAPMQYALKVQHMLVHKTYACSAYTSFIKNDKGKLRDISKLPFFPDRIVQHAILQVLEPIWKPTLIHSTYQSIRGRGVHACLTKIQHAVQVQRLPYCLQMDVRKFYPSVHVGTLKTILRRKVKCPDTLHLLDLIAESSVGLPIGNYISQYFGNLYLSALDHYCKEVLKVRHYYRYCDDIIILDSCKERLHKLKEEVQEQLHKVRLQLKGNWQVYQVSEKRGVDCLGFVVFPKRTRLRRSLYRSFRDKLLIIKRTGRVQQMSLSAYFGWFKHANCVSVWRKDLREVLEYTQHHERHKLIKLLELT